MTTISDEDIQGITENVWVSTLGLGVDPAAPFTGSSADMPSGRVDIGGAWTGTVMVRCAPPLAREVAAIMFQTEPETATALQVSDAITEIVNMIGGNLKALLPEPCALAIPVVGDGTAVDGRIAVEMTFECLGHAFIVSVHARDAAVAAVGA
jgi:chemotaxis protein CheX